MILWAVLGLLFLWMVFGPYRPALRKAPMSDDKKAELVAMQADLESLSVKLELEIRELFDLQGAVRDAQDTILKCVVRPDVLDEIRGMIHLLKTRFAKDREG